MFTNIYIWLKLLGPNVLADLIIDRDHQLIMDFLPTKFEASETNRSWVLQLHKVLEINVTFSLDLWPTELNINRDHLLMKDYLPTKFEASGVKLFWIISCTRFWRLTWPLTLTFGDHLLMKDCLPTKFGVSGGKAIWLISQRWVNTFIWDDGPT